MNFTNMIIAKIRFFIVFEMQSFFIMTFLEIMQNWLQYLFKYICENFMIKQKLILKLIFLIIIKYNIFL